MKILSRVFWAWQVCLICLVSPNHAQNFGTRQSIDSSDFYIFTEAGGQYIPNIPISDINLGSESFVVNSGGTSYDVNISSSLQNNYISPDIGYNFIGGFGYEINRNVSFELEVGYQYTPLGTGTSTLNAPFSVSGGGSSFTGTVSGNISLNSTGNLTQTPILINCVIQNRHERFMPFASIGLGVCPSTIHSKATQVIFNDTTVSVGGTSVNTGSLELGTVDLGNSSTSYPFMFKLKAGFDYALNQHIDLGLRAWCSGITGSEFGNGIDSEIYAVVGLTGALKIKF